MKLLVGLGNPGEKYIHTRHNVGFDVVDIISQKLNININKQKHKSLIGEGYINGQKIILAKPQTFMNLSGEAVCQLMNWYKIEEENLVVIYDDIDLEMGKIRLKDKGSAGTHNGMRNIINILDSSNFARLRVGVGRPKDGYNLVDWVLSSYNSKEDRQIMFDAFMLAADLAIEYCKTDYASAKLYLSKQLANK